MTKCSQDEGSCRTAARALEIKPEQIRNGVATRRINAASAAKSTHRRRHPARFRRCSTSVSKESPAIGAWQCLIEIVDQSGLLIKAVRVSAAG
jgi:hypothetical protein